MNAGAETPVRWISLGIPALCFLAPGICQIVAPHCFHNCSMLCQITWVRDKIWMNEIWNLIADMSEYRFFSESQETLLPSGPQNSSKDRDERCRAGLNMQGRERRGKEWWKAMKKNRKIGEREVFFRNQKLEIFSFKDFLGDCCLIFLEFLCRKTLEKGKINKQGAACAFSAVVILSSTALKSPVHDFGRSWLGLPNFKEAFFSS